VKTRVGTTITCFSALLFAFFSGSVLQGQAPESPNPGSHPQAAGPAGQDATNDLYVAVGKSVLVDSARPIQRVSVGLGDYAEATAVGPTEILVNGKAPGQTSLIIWETGGERQFFNVTVGASNYVENDKLQSLRRELRTELPGQQLKVSSENGMIFLRGTVKDINSSDRAVQIASTAGKVVNLLYVDVPAAQPQILLKVRFESFDRSKTNNLGINIFSLGAANTIGAITTQQFPGPTISAPTGTTPAATFSNLLNLFIFRPDLNLGATIAALEINGVLQVLAEPNLLTENGKEASFLAGGEYPYPTVQGISGTGTGAITIQFKEFGIRLNFIPTITPRGTIRLQVAPEVSALDFTDGIQISGFTVPALTVRKVNTEVELSQGQSFAIGGLLDNRVTQSFQKIPFIGDIPVLGRFFQSISKVKTNTELLVIVTPEIVSPIPAGAPLPEIDYPVAFLPPNSKSPMMNPGPSETGAAPPPAPPATITVEQLVESMKPEKPLIIDSGGGYSSGGTGGMGGQVGATPPQ
jgi:pilus assembly protein CpaC